MYFWYIGGGKGVSSEPSYSAILISKHDELIRTVIAGTYFQSFWSSKLGWDLRVGIYNRFSGDADDSGLGTTLWPLCVRVKIDWSSPLLALDIFPKVYSNCELSTWSLEIYWRIFFVCFHNTLKREILEKIIAPRKYKTTATKTKHLAEVTWKSWCHFLWWF